MLGTLLLLQVVAEGAELNEEFARRLERARTVDLRIGARRLRELEVRWVVVRADKAGGAEERHLRAVLADVEPRVLADGSVLFELTEAGD